MSGFASRLIAWHRRDGRHDLPWQGTRDPYRIWVSEIMLQQTQVATVIPYYRRFLERFPDIATLAAAPLDEVLGRWSGLGYYSRARNLHRAAQSIVSEYRGRFPRDFDTVIRLPGIGRSTAGAICAFAYGARHAILDGNVKRVLARHYGIRGYPGERSVEADLWRKAAALLPRKDIGLYTQALMDLGASICKRRRPSCAACPVVTACVAYQKGLTDALPAPRPKKPLPQRSTRMLVLEHAGKVLLEKRPASGVWGALWSLPEAEPGEDLGVACSTRFGVRVTRATKLPRLEHGFTHFRLSIEPWHLHVSTLATRAAEPRHAWFTPEEASSAALPAPVRRILVEIRTKTESPKPPRAEKTKQLPRNGTK